MKMVEVVPETRRKDGILLDNCENFQVRTIFKSFLISAFCRGNDGAVFQTVLWKGYLLFQKKTSHTFSNYLQICRFYPILTHILLRKERELIKYLYAFCRAKK